MSGYYGPSGFYLYDSEEYVTLTKATHDALAARVREMEEALREIIDKAATYASDAAARPDIAFAARVALNPEEPNP